MIEVLFGESEGGCMKAAKNYRKPDLKHGATAWVGRKPTEEELDQLFADRLEGKPVGGNSSEVVCIPLMLDFGDISLPVDSEYRKSLIHEMYTINGILVQGSLVWLEEAWVGYQNEIERLKKFASSGENIRIWYSDAPYSACGLRYVCCLLREYNIKVSVIKLPTYILLSDNTIQSYVSWGEVEPGKFHRFLPLEKELSPLEINSFASEWNELKQEGSMLRAVVNGRLIGVPEDFYDHIIRKELPDGEFLMARLIGDVLGKHSLGVGDYWYAKRILRMIDQGELEIIHKQKDTYRQVLRKTFVKNNK